ncbi:VanZ family protein [Patescibacteria group bacterium]|nr:VanZ family protein [Patescibacteria group bacterium]
MKKCIRYWLPVIIYMAAIFIASSRQKVAISDSYAISFLFFKTLHLIEYIFLYLVCYRAFFNTGTRKDKAFLYAFIITVLYAATDEIHQRLVPTREGKFRDVIIDVIGGGFGWLIITSLLPKAPKKLKTLAKRLQILS